LFQAAHVGPTLGQLWHFKVFAPERIQYAIRRFETEAGRVFRVLDGQLARHAHIAGEEYGIPDVMTWPWIHAGVTDLGLLLNEMPHLARWYATVASRPAVQRGMRVPTRSAATEVA
jgi:GST-like protein